MATTEKTIVELVQELPPALHDEVRDFVEFLIEKQRRKLAQQAEAKGWPVGYFESTAGSIPDFPDRDSHGIEPTLDETAADLNLDTSEGSSS
jgi:hypothetical protein